jgi:hypothetical protein
MSPWVTHRGSGWDGYPAIRKVLVFLVVLLAVLIVITLLTR